MADEARGALADERVAKRERSPLPPGVMVRFQRIAAAKSPAGNYILELGDDGGIRIARHSGSTGDWRTPMDVALPPQPSAKAKFGTPRKIRKLLADVHTNGEESPTLVEGAPVKDGVFEVVTLPPDREIVYDGVDNELLRALRKVAEGVG